MAATKKRTTGLIPGHATHTRTQDAYMGALLDAVTLDDWREVVTGAVQAGKGGDPAARAWLGQYLVGKPESKAPAPLNVIVDQLRGHDPVIRRLAGDFATSAYDVEFHGAPDNRAQITQQLQIEISEKINAANLSEKPVSMRASGDSDPE